MNSKAKGNTFERNMSRMLSLWWTGGKRDDAIWRSASSGALATTGKGRYTAHSGDFAAVDEEAMPLFDRVIIEAKKGYNRYSMQDLIDVPEKSLKNNPIIKMLEKLYAVCKEQNKWGFILWKRDRRELLVLYIMKNLPIMSACYFGNIAALEVAGPAQGMVYALPWKDFSKLISVNRIKSLPVPPVSSSEGLLVNPSSELD